MGQRSFIPFILACAAISLWVLSGCGGNPGEQVSGPDAVSGATDAPTKKEADAETTPKPELHLCEKPIDAPDQVFPRIEAVRLLPAEELATTCGLGFVEKMSEWRSLPVDLLAPIVAGAGADEEALTAWVTEKAPAAPKAAADVVAMDIAGSWKVGDDPAAVEERLQKWASAGEAASEIKAVVEAASGLTPLLTKVNEIHRLRCMLEVNALGFAVKCKPIHPQGKNIELSWKTTTREGLIEDLQISKCKGKTCKRLKKTAAKLKAQYLALVADIEKVPVTVFQEQLKTLLVLPPFKSTT